MTRRERRKKRRHRRRARQAEVEATPPAVANDAPVNWSRLRQVFGNLSHRGTKVFDRYVLSPVVVDAGDPSELVEATEHAIVDETKKQQPS